MANSIDDIMICPKCNSDDTYSISTDEIEFNNDNTGHYDVDCKCRKCGTIFRLCTDFTYNIVSHHTR